MPKILLLDVETQPDLVWTWGVYEQNAIAVKEHWQLLSFSAEWFGRNGTQVTKGLPDFKGYKPGGDDYNLCIAVWRLLDEADVVIAHNGIDFDLKVLNARFIAWGLKPPSPYKTVDTKREMKKVARFSSNKLDWICRQLELGKKLEHEGWEMWAGCMAGDKKAWAKMLRYNRHDVVLLRKLYSTLAPWISQPNAALWGGETPVCPNLACGGTDLMSRGFARSRTRSYRRFVCKKCGSWARAVYSEQKHAGVVKI